MSIVFGMVFRKLWRKWSGLKSDRGNGESAAEEGISDSRERCSPNRRDKERLSVRELLSKKERIRRLYRREVWANRERLLDGGNTERLKRLTAWVSVLRL